MEKDELLFSDEIWIDIIGFQTLYKISNYGRVKSLRNGKETILKLDENNCGYYRVTLFKDKKRHRFLVHRLVAEHFIPNPNNLPLVNHKDETTYNNHVSNLEWVDYSENQLYGSVRQRKSKSRLIFEKNNPFKLY